MKEQLYGSRILKYFQRRNWADSQPPSSLSEVFMRCARQRSFKSSSYLPSKEGRGVNIVAFSVACLDCSLALSWVFCCWAWKSCLCSHWTLGLSNETAKGDGNYCLLSPVLRLRAKPASPSQRDREGKLPWGQSSRLCSGKPSPLTCWQCAASQGKNLKSLLFQHSLLAKDFSPQGVRDIYMPFNVKPSAVEKENV